MEIHWKPQLGTQLGIELGTSTQLYPVRCFWNNLFSSYSFLTGQEEDQRTEWELLHCSCLKFISSNVQKLLKIKLWTGYSTGYSTGYKLGTPLGTRLGIRSTQCCSPSISTNSSENGLNFSGWGLQGVIWQPWNFQADRMKQSLCHLSLPEGSARLLLGAQVLPLKWPRRQPMALDEFSFSFHQTLGLAYWMWELAVARVWGGSHADWPKSLSDSHT